ncbi:platelet binding protein GspB isoform X4 [Cherax quadricarinatus]|uniref:platelet binding protein GspB isoform X4 n=1 Tax=Cherax quadricarinatus TaxID=27406 RepID=UPI00387ECC29
MMEEVDLSDQPRQRVNSDNLSSEVDETPDPRIQVELERLNTSTDTINKLEVDLDEARMLFRQLLADSTHRIDILAKRLGKCVEQSRPYYDARINAKQALRETQAAAVRYERAMSQHAAAREMVFLAEEGLMQKGCVFDHTWQEMLNHATSKVNDAEREKIESAAEHRRTSALYHEAETRVKALQKELKRAIAKSSLNARRSLLQMNNLVRMHQLQLLPYFELKSAVNQQLEAQKQQVRQLEESVARAKVTYAQALSNLETISDEIHRQTAVTPSVTAYVTTCTAATKLSTTAASHLTAAAAATAATTNAAAAITTTAAATAAAAVTTATMTAATITTAAANTTAAAATAASAAATAAAAAAATAAYVMTQCDSQAGGSAVSGTCTAEENCSTAREGGQDRSLVMDAGDVLAEDVDEAATCTDLSGWQVIGLGSPALSPATQYLAVEDRDSIISDTESLASIEMLSDEAIAGLMLDEELAEASTSICTPLNTPIVDPPLSLASAIQSWPTFFQSYVNAAQRTAEMITSHSKFAQQDHDDEESSGITESLTGLELDSLHTGTRQLQPPHTLSLHHDSSSDQSSPEDLTPGYAPLRDTPYSPEDFLPSSQDNSAQPFDEAQEEPHCSSWILEKLPLARK